MSRGKRNPPDAPAQVPAASEYDASSGSEDTYLVAKLKEIREQIKIASARGNFTAVASLNRTEINVRARLDQIRKEQRSVENVDDADLFEQLLTALQALEPDQVITLIKEARKLLTPSRLHELDTD